MTDMKIETEMKVGILQFHSDKNLRGILYTCRCRLAKPRYEQLRIDITVKGLGKEDCTALGFYANCVFETDLH